MAIGGGGTDWGWGVLMKHWTIGRKIGFLLAIILLADLAKSVVAIYQLGRINDSTTELVNTM